MKTMPDSSARFTAAWLIFSGSISPSISCWSKIGRALLTVRPAGLRLLGHDLLEHVLKVHLHLLEIARAQNRDRRHRPAGKRDLDLFILELTGLQASLHLVARPLPALGGLGRLGRVGFLPRGRGSRRQEEVEQPVLDLLLGLLDDLQALGVAHQDDRGFDQVADQALDVTADIADLGILGGLGLDEGCADEHRQPARDLGLADAGRADQHDVLGRDLLAQVVGELPAPPAVAQRDRDGPLGLGLPDDVAVQLGHGLAGRQLTFALGLTVWHGSSSTVRFKLV